MFQKDCSTVSSLIIPEIKSLHSWGMNNLEVDIQKPVFGGWHIWKATLNFFHYQLTFYFHIFWKTMIKQIEIFETVLYNIQNCTYTRKIFLLITCLRSMCYVCRTPIYWHRQCCCSQYTVMLNPTSHGVSDYVAPRGPPLGNQGRCHFWLHVAI